MSALAQAIVIASVLAGSPARGRAQERPAPRAPFESALPPRPLVQQELSGLAADGAHKEKAWTEEHRERRRALLKNPAWKRLSRTRRKAILNGLAEELRARKAGWREAVQARRLAILRDSDRRAMSHSERAGLWALQARLQEKQSRLREEYAFGRAALIKELESRPVSAADKAADLHELEAELRRLEVRLNDAFWDERCGSLPDEGARAGSRDKTGIGGGHESEKGRSQEQAGGRAGAEDAQGAARLGTGG
jgi:hypothetical protein